MGGLNYLLLQMVHLGKQGRSVLGQAMEEKEK